MLKFDAFNLNDDNGYQQWRTQKIKSYEQYANNAVVSIAAETPSVAELTEIKAVCKRFNYVIYQLSQPEKGTKRFVHDLGERLGLHRLDGNLCSDDDNITSIQVQTRGRRSGYIPYTNKPLTWHTDGYYNDDEQTIRAMMLHCVRPAVDGGDNLLLDHEMAYIQLRDENPEYIQAFMQPNVLTIPANIENGKEIRAAQSGPVFSIDPQQSALHMRYSARSRNIEWHDDELTLQAVNYMRQLLDTNNPYVLTYRMRAGQGIIANNTLHNRTAFTDAEDNEQKRLLYRARYYDRVASE